MKKIYSNHSAVKQFYRFNNILLQCSSSESAAVVNEKGIGCDGYDAFTNSNDASRRVAILNDEFHASQCGL